MRLLSLSTPVQKLLLAGDLEMGHARTLVSLSAAQQVLLANEIVAKRLSVREAEKRTARLQLPGADARSRTAAAPKTRDLVRLEEQLADKLTAKVEIRVRGRQGERGEIAISFASIDELTGLLDRLGIQAH
jgi:ParB family chromosome partitioning protein